MSKDERAFPWANDADKEYNWINKGMTLRDYFAAKAMQGMLMRGYVNIEHLPVNAYKFADAMIAEREKE